jgi:hypothetical protein
MGLGPTNVRGAELTMDKARPKAEFDSLLYNTGGRVNSV